MVRGHLFFTLIILFKIVVVMTLGVIGNWAEILTFELLEAALDGSN